MTRPSKLVTAARIVLGLIFVLSGLNHVFALVPMPPVAGATALFWQGLKQTGYFLTLLGVIEVAAGALLLRGRWLPLALAMIAPIAVNVAAFHAVLAPQGLGIAALVLAAGGFLAWRHRQAFAPALQARAAVVGGAARAVEIAVGLAFVASGIAGLTGHTPPSSTPGAAVMLKGLAAAGYFLPLLCGVEIAAGALLVARRFVGVALWALAPVVVQILAYRLYVATPGMLVVGLGLCAAEAWLAFVHRAQFRSFFTGGSGGQAMTLPGLPRVAA
jgi:uncharacterized membrane protein YphA (DoxX/SURF4 family)